MARVTPPAVDRAAASRAAVAARRARAAIKRTVESRERSALAVLNAGWNDPEAVAEATLRVRELLLSMPGLGPKRVAAMMTELSIADSKRVGGLGIRQREKLREWILARDARFAPPPSAKLVVLAGPTAVGKGTVSTHIRENHPRVHLSVSATTRQPRPGEQHGINYFFVSDEEFDRLIAGDEMLEWATVHNAHRYGTPRGPVEEALAAGFSVLLEIDLQGARQIKVSAPEAVLVFLLPPSWEELVRRLIGRGTEAAAEQQRRLATAKVELAAQNEFDHRIVNHEVSQAAQEVVDLMGISHDRG
ncbi:MAG: guanylate kinase [Microbacteriaceae bacterium]|nr:guanylate kinase [Microbacteriaceae bacterium]